MSFQGLQDRLSALQETTAQLRDLVDRLASLRFQPGSVPLDVSEEDSVSGELSGEISRLLKQGEEDAELLGEEAEYLRLEEERESVREGVARVERDLKSHRSAFKRAKLAAKKNLVQAQRQERELILQSYSQPPSEPISPMVEDENTNGDASTAALQQPVPSLRQHHRSNVHQHQQLSALSEEDKHTVGASTNVTNALRRTHDLIASELERSDFARQTLAESSAALKGLTESYGSLDDMLAGTRKLLGTLVKSQKSDTWYLQTTFWMLVVTAVWLLFRRLVFGPAMLFIWWPLRILFGVGSKAVQVTTGTGGGKKVGGVGEEGKVSVDGMPGEDLPTVKVGQDKSEGTDQVEKMIEKANEAEELGSIPEGEVDRAVVDGEAHVRDEL
ncbi:sec20 domain-containing protein [Sarocladium implicatum]|nr:sec20 domain-containing protein [Sarocladium implicatum]